MKNKFAHFIMTNVVILNIGVFILFGIILYNEFTAVEPTIEPTVEPEQIETQVSKQPQEQPQEPQEQPSSEVVEENEPSPVEEEIKTPEIVTNPFEAIQQNASGAQKQSNYSEINVDKFFYNQLEDEAKTIYRGLEANKDNMKTGTYKVDFGNTFTSLLDQADGQDKIAKYYQSAIEAFTYDNPEIFYLNPNSMYLNVETVTIGTDITHNVYINNGGTKSYLVKEFSSKEQIDSAMSQVQQARQSILQNRKNNTYENIKMVHDYLIEHITYDSSLSKNNIYNIVGAMVNKEAVCEGYARSFKYCMDALGIPCVIVIGEGTNSEGHTEKHAWNYVQMYNKWYAVDSTWDDPISTSGFVTPASKFRYLLKGAKTMSKDHRPNGQFTDGGKVFSYPELNQDDYYI